MHGAVSTKPGTIVRVRQVSQMETKQVTKPETSKHLCVEPNKKPEIHEINNFFKDSFCNHLELDWSTGLVQQSIRKCRRQNNGEPGSNQEKESAH